MQSKPAPRYCFQATDRLTERPTDNLENTKTASKVCRLLLREMLEILQCRLTHLAFPFHRPPWPYSLPRPLSSRQLEAEYTPCCLRVYGSTEPRHCRDGTPLAILGGTSR